MEKYYLAHTNVQLLNQLRNAGYSHADLFYIFEIYKFVIELCYGFQSSGKLFIVHLIRTASILVSLQTNISVIAAGLLHSVYEFGDFGDGSRGLRDWKRARVRQRCGEITELIVMKYSTLQWTEPVVCNNLVALESNEQDAILIRLVNQLELCLDLEVLYQSNYVDIIQNIKEQEKLLIEMAIALGYPHLAAQLAETFQEILSINDFLAYPRDSAYFSQVSGRLSVKQLLMIRLKSQFKQVKISFVS
ncbi:MAG: hypothetical protein KME23_23720 [Goleter apudmare HA4340-LM2]|jgi:(p)ppGpp synthase/HD superfamily hydrolase|nr:hypothetical protein [Goleter apudmare HA4340-LM2]